MMSMSILRRSLLTLAAAAAAGAGPALAQEWAPSKTVRIVVPIVGGTNDLVARLVAPELQKALGQPVIVENKGGAGGTIGATEVARAAHDGHQALSVDARRAHDDRAGIPELRGRVVDRLPRAWRNAQARH